MSIGNPQEAQRCPSLSLMENHTWTTGFFLFLTWFLLSALLSCALAEVQPATGDKNVWKLRVPGDIPAPVQRAAIDRDPGTVHLATLTELYHVQNKDIQRVSARPGPNGQIALASGGAVYAQLTAADGPAPLWHVQLFSVAGESLATLRPETPPLGFGGIYLGYRGKLIVTVTAIDDWRGIRGRYRFTFWNLDGQILKTVIRPTREFGVIAADGSSFLLLGEKEATAYSPDGNLLWRLDGQFRKGAIARNGELALLNPSPLERIHNVVIFTGSQRPIEVEMPTPVHELVLAPDGAAVVGGDRGRFFFLDTQKGDVKEGARLPFDAELFLTDLKFVDHDTIAIGVLQREGKPPSYSWPRGSLIVVTRDGDVLFKQDFPIRKQISSRPAVEATFGLPFVVAFTLDEAVHIELGR
ncbi:MAG: hypothetical protein OEZ11_09020 [Gammaproteobacteria bacterium]|nr:hypothetical protein [Gammaproteobacteria bacterium]